MASHNKLFLHDHGASSYCQKVRIALRQKGIPFDRKVPENMGSGQVLPGLAKANPRMEVPALEDGDFKIFDSKVILGYLEDKFPETPLLPKDPKARAEAKLIEEVCDAQYEAINWGLGEVNWSQRATGELADKLVSQAKSQTETIQKWLLTYLGDRDYFNGDSFGYADVCVAPYVNRSFSYGFIPQGSTLYRWRMRLTEIPAVNETWDEMEAAIKQMSTGFKDLFKAGTGRKREYRDHRLEWMIRSGGIEIVEKGLEQSTIRFSWPGGI